MSKLSLYEWSRTTPLHISDHPNIRSNPQEPLFCKQIYRELWSTSSLADPIQTTTFSSSHLGSISTCQPRHSNKHIWYKQAPVSPHQHKTSLPDRPGKACSLSSTVWGSDIQGTLFPHVVEIQDQKEKKPKSEKNQGNLPDKWCFQNDFWSCTQQMSSHT